MLMLDEVAHLLKHLLFFNNPVKDVWTIKTRDEFPGMLQESLHDLLTRFRISRSGERHAGNVGKKLLELRERSVLRPEVVSPNAHEMRFVDGEKRHPEAS